MPEIPCEFPGCTYKTGEHSTSIAIAMLNSHVAFHTQPPAARVERATRPTISTGTSTEKWSYFTSRWEEYKASTQVSGPQCTLQLLECCDPILRNDLFQSNGSLLDRTEAEVMAAIKLLAVPIENTMVARVGLNNMRQDYNEGVRQYVSRLKGQAGICKFIATEKCSNCNHNVTHNYSDAMVRDALTRGLANIDIQQDLLGEANQDMTLEEVTSYVQAKERARNSAAKLANGHTTGAISKNTNDQSTGMVQSSHRRQNAQSVIQHHQTPKNTSPKCTYCGNMNHGKFNDIKARRRYCPAYGKQCKKCKYHNHFTHLCKQRSPQNNSNQTAIVNNSDDTQPSDEDTADAVYQLCTISNKE